MLLSDFHWKENDGFRVIPVHPGLVTSDYGIHEVGVTVCGVQYVHQLTLLTGGKNSRKRMKVEGRLMQARLIEIHQVFTERSDTFLTEQYK